MLRIEGSSRTRDGLWLSFFLAVVVLVAAAGALMTDASAGSWFASLEKPSWQPPSWLFGPVWSVLYLMIAVAGWLWWQEGDEARPALAWWAGQLALNFAWTAAFFRYERPGFSLVIIGLLLVAIMGTIIVGWQIRRSASFLLLPYLGWTLFAASLNAAILVGGP